MARPTITGCGALGGVSPRTGEPVGERHRWNGGAWGEGRCIFCGNDLNGVLSKPTKTISLDQALALGEAETRVNAWQPIFWDSRKEAETGWYVKRGWVGATEWLRGEDGRALQFPSKAAALAAIDAAPPDA